MPTSSPRRVGSPQSHDLTGGVALLDDHKGYYPYVMEWDWVTSATRDATGRVATLPAVTFQVDDARGPDERWRIRDRAGRVALEFEPTVPGDLALNALVIESRYRGPFGTLRGRLEPDGLPAIEVNDWFGMGEQFYLRC